MNYHENSYDREIQRSGGVIHPYKSGNYLPGDPSSYSSYSPYGNSPYGNMYGTELERNGLDVRLIFEVLFQRKWVIIAITMLGLLAGALIAMQMTPIYKGQATIEFQKQETRIIAGSSVDPVNVADAVFMETQYELLQSRSLAERVVELNGLELDPNYADQTLDYDERLKQASEKIMKHTSVIPRGRSRVVSVEFISPIPAEVERIPNALVESFIESALDRKYETTAYAREFLTKRLALTKQVLENKEQELVAYAQANNILELERNGQEASLEADALIDLNEEQIAAELERITLEREFDDAKSSRITSQLLQDSEYIRLNETKSELKAEYVERLALFKPQYPDMLSLQARIDAVEVEIQGQRVNALIALEKDYKAAEAKEKSIKNRMSQLKSTLQDLRNRSIKYTILQREVDTNRSQYEALLQRLKDISGNVGSSQASIVDRAIKPKHPFKPNIVSILLRALLLSTTLGVCLALFMNYIDDKIKTPQDIKRKLMIPVIGIIPKIKGKPDILRELGDPRSPITEGVFSSLTSLEFATSEGVPNTIAITSTGPNEGKTSMTTSIAVAFAKMGKSVLIIDADMRKPSFLASPLKSKGLSSLLTSNNDMMSEVCKSDKVEGLSLLPVGAIPPNASELLSGRRLKEILQEAEDNFEIVIVDTPPVLSFSDSPILGSLCKGVLIVVQSGRNRTPDVMRTINRMRDSQSNVIGALLTKFDAKKDGYYYSYYGYGAQEKPDKNNRVEVFKKISLFGTTETDTVEAETST